MAGLSVAGVYTDPGLRWLEDEPEPDPDEPVETLAVSAGVVGWTAAPLDDDE